MIFGIYCDKNNDSFKIEDTLVKVWYDDIGIKNKVYKGWSKRLWKLLILRDCPDKNEYT